MSSNGENSVNLRYTVEEWIRLTWRDRLSGDGEMMETETDFIFMGSKITADGTLGMKLKGV